MRSKLVRALLLASCSFGIASPAFSQAAPETSKPSHDATCSRLPLGATYALDDPAVVLAFATAKPNEAGGVPSRLIRRSSSAHHARPCPSHEILPWLSRQAHTIEIGGGGQLTISPVRWRAHFNSTYPRDLNNGAVWTGRGFSTSLTGGFGLRWGVLSAGLQPVISASENRPFTTQSVARPGYVQLINPNQPSFIDWPQRFGTESFWRIFPGRSYLRVDAFGVAVGVSTESLWWGPALRYPVLMSNTAPGYPHAFLGTSEPVDIGVGHLDVEASWGHLYESEYFDQDPSNDRRLLAALAVSVTPRWLPGLSIGAARVHLSYTERFQPADYLLRPYTDVRRNVVGRNHPLGDNQIISLFARWTAPEDGFEVHGEWAREDHWGSILDLLSEPDHSQAFALGFQKVVSTSNRRVRLFGEVAALGRGSTARSGRTGGYFYTHSQIRQGYTHRGQLLGAPIGPGSDAQLVGTDLFATWGRVGAYAERIRYDNDAYYDRWAPYYGYSGHDVELTFGLRGLLFLGPFDVSADVAYSYRRNRNFIGLERFDWNFLTETNWGVELGLTWNPTARTDREQADGAPVTTPQR